ncbi:Uncharacterised protein [Mycobacteroides abscessus subsp. abscessus]|nr:Uncharacterised protein [Mycobacteroides abscessus subsp. abscessus]
MVAGAFGQLCDPPGIAADFHELPGGREHPFDCVDGVAVAHRGGAAAEEQPPSLLIVAQPDVGAHGRHVAAPVIKAEQESAGQLGEGGGGRQPAVKRGNQGACVRELAGPSR